MLEWICIPFHLITRKVIKTMEENEELLRECRERGCTVVQLLGARVTNIERTQNTLIKILIGVLISTASGAIMLAIQLFIMLTSGLPRG